MNGFYSILFNKMKKLSIKTYRKIMSSQSSNQLFYAGNNRAKLVFCQMYNTLGTCNTLLKSWVHFVQKQQNYGEIKNAGN